MVALRGRPRVHKDGSSTTRAAARRAQLAADGGREMTIAMSRDDLDRIAALRARERLPSDAAAVRRALEIAAASEQM